MTATEQHRLGKALWAIADKLRGSMMADDFRDYMLSFIFLRYLSEQYEDWEVIIQKPSKRTRLR